MLSGWVILLVACAYLCLLFAIAYYGDKRADAGPQPDRQPLHLRPVDRGLLHLLDLLRQRRPGGLGAASLPADLSRPDADLRAVVVRAAQDHPDQQGQPDHLDRRLHLLALRQEHAAVRPGDGDRGGRHHAVHLAAAEGGLDQLQPAAAAIPGGRRRATRQRAAAADTAFWSPWCWPPSRSCSAPATSTPASITRAWSPRSPSSRSSSWSPSWRSAVRHLRAATAASATCSPGRPHAGADAALQRSERRRLRPVGHADAAVHGRDHLPAAAVPGDGGRERRRTAI